MICSKENRACKLYSIDEGSRRSIPGLHPERKAALWKPGSISETD